MEVSDGGTIYDRVLCVMQKIAERLILSGFGTKMLEKQVSLTCLVGVTICYTIDVCDASRFTSESPAQHNLRV